MTNNATVLARVAGPGVAVRGADIDTDRIIPARFLKALTFDGLGTHVFDGDRKNAALTDTVHPFDDPIHANAKVLLVNENFGCGSSREHAPQAINRWGIDAIVGVSFGEIFEGNCATIGLPCLHVSAEDAVRLQERVESAPDLPVTVDLEELTVSAGDLTVPATMNESVRRRFVNGEWDSLTLLKGASDKVAKVLECQPYLGSWTPAGTA